MSRRLIVFLSGVSLFLFFILFSYFVHKDFFTQFDFDMTVKLQDNLSRRFDNIFSFFSDFGKFEVMIVILMVFFAVLRKWVAGLVAFFLFGVFHLIELFGKFFVHHLPPPQFMLRTKEIIDFPQFHVRSEFSYPSGHAGRTAFLSIIFLIFVLTNDKLPQWVKVLLCVGIISYDIVMFVSRPYLGEHWSSDVIGGALLGFAFGLVTSAVMMQSKKKKQEAS